MSDADETKALVRELRDASDAETKELVRQLREAFDEQLTHRFNDDKGRAQARAAAMKVLESVAVEQLGGEVCEVYGMPDGRVVVFIKLPSLEFLPSPAAFAEPDGDHE